jgi:D-glycero-D-manno-heptose 1,7-bisphosphate phosphatase
MGIDAVKRRAVFLDRDGVLNRAIVREGKPYPPRQVSQLEILPGVPEALDNLRKAGFILVMVTNQPDIARGAAQKRDVDAINDELREKLSLDDVRICCHDDRDACNCRKPLPGMLLDAARELDIDLPKSYMVGDRWRDIEAGRRAGCKTIFIDYGYSEDLKCVPDLNAASLAEAAIQILKEREI